MTRKEIKSNSGVIIVLISCAILALSSAVSKAQEIPGCIVAWNILVAHEALPEARTLIGNDCPVMYRKGWLVNPRKLSQAVIPSCFTAWNSLEHKNSLPAVHFLVSHNCPVIERLGWRQIVSSSAGTPFKQTVAGNASGTIAVSMRRAGGIYMVPVRINNALTLNFLLDSGASDVSIPSDVVLTLVRTGTITKSDFIGTKTYIMANGSKLPAVNFRIRSLTVGGVTLQDVVADITPVRGPLLLGQSFLGRFKSWSINNARHVLLLEGGPFDGSQRPARMAALYPIGVTKTIKGDVSFGYMNLRAGPGLDHAVIARVPAGTSGIIIKGPCTRATDSNDHYTFCFVKWNGYEGWISASGFE